MKICVALVLVCIMGTLGSSTLPLRAGTIGLEYLADDPVTIPKKYGLFIGVSRYPEISGLKQLPRTVPGAVAMAKRFKEFGFETTVVPDPTRKALQDAFRAFSDKLEEGDEAVVFYSGHGFEIETQGGVLIPIDSHYKKKQIRSEYADSGIPINWITSTLQSKNLSRTFLFVDACRDDPFFSDGVGQGAKGLEQFGLSPPKLRGFYAFYAASPSQQALHNFEQDDKDSYTLFTRVLLAELKPHRKLRAEIEIAVQKEVYDQALKAGRSQVPMSTVGFVGDYCFNGCELPGVPSPSVAVRPPKSKPAVPLSVPEEDKTQVAIMLKAPDPLKNKTLITEIQTRLAKAGCLLEPNSIDGHWGPLTRDAILRINLTRKLKISSDGPTPEAVSAISADGAKCVPFCLGLNKVSKGICSLPAEAAALIERVTQGRIAIEKRLVADKCANEVMFSFQALKEVPARCKLEIDHALIDANELGQPLFDMLSAGNCFGKIDEHYTHNCYEAKSEWEALNELKKGVAPVSPDKPI